MRPKEVKQIINKAVEDPVNTPPIMLWGPPGVGKSSIVQQVTEERGIDFLDIRLAQRDPTDLRGIPVPEDGHAKWLQPAELPRDGRGIMILDELPSAPPLVQVSAYQLTFDGKIGEYELPEGWYIVCAGNRIQDRAVVHRMSSALNNRLIHVDFEANVPDWITWALGVGLDPNIIAFIQWRGDELLFKFNPESEEKAFPSPRCLGGETEIKMWDGSFKTISDIKVGDEIVGYEKGFRKAIVTKTFQTYIEQGLELSSSKRKIRCSHEHHFLTDRGYLQAKDICANTPVYITMEGDTNVYRENYAEEETMVRKAKPVRNEQGLPSSTDRRGGLILSSPSEKVGEGILRALFRHLKLLLTYQGLSSKYGLYGSHLQAERVTNKIYYRDLGELRSISDRRIITLPNSQEASSALTARIHQVQGETEMGDSDGNHSRTPRYRSLYSAYKLQATRETISVRERNYQEVFYDFTSTSGNYIANGFIVHNSWEFASQMLKICPKALLPEVLEGTIGKGATAEFTGFLKVQTELPDLNEIFEGKDIVPKRMDLRYALTSALVSRAKNAKQFNRLLEYSMALPAEYSVMLVQLLASKNQGLVATSTNFKKWSRVHSEIAIDRKMI